MDDIRIAVSEVCTNAVLGRDGATDDDAITVTWREDDGRVIVEVSDRGQGDQVSDSPTDSQGFSSRLVMSEALLREMADDLTVEAHPGGGTSTRLAFSLD